MANDRAQHPAASPRGAVPKPTATFRKKAWLHFQRALDPLAPPRPLRRSHDAAA